MIRRVKIELIENVHLPRFTMSKGDTWEVRPDRIEKEGFKLGGGFITNNQYAVKGVVYK